MIGMFNEDSSYFIVRPVKPQQPSPGGPIAPAVSFTARSDAMEANTISLSITEEINKATIGTLTLNDPDLIYANMFRRGKRISIEWGYKKESLSIEKLQQLFQNPQEVKGNAVRKNFQATIISDSGDADDKGNHIITMQFRALNTFSVIKKSRNYIGTRYSVVFEVMSSMGITAPFIKFPSMVESEFIKRDNLPDMAFLRRLADKYVCQFRVAQSPSGILLGYFCKPEDLQLSTFPSLVCSGVPTIGGKLLLDWRDGIHNIKKYKWEQNDTDTPGDTITVTDSNPPQVVRSPAPEEKVQAYKISPEKIRAALKKAKAKGGIAAESELTASILGADTLTKQLLKDYFEPVIYKTAPQGQGYKVTADVFGNPFMVPPVEIQFGSGFPGRLRNKFFTWRITKCVHTLSRPGYHGNIEINDYKSFF